MRTWFVAIVMILVFAQAVPSPASVPPMISYQGKLLQPSGVPVADGSYSIQFAIYDIPTEGTALWSETNPNVQVKGGLFGVLLGSVVNLPSNIFDSPDRFFGIKVGSDAEMTPRQQIAATPFAFKAAVAQGAEPGSITTEMLADGAITASKINAENWTHYTPTWTTESGSPPTIGNGFLTGYYILQGKTVQFTMTIVIGSTTNVGTGAWLFGVPTGTIYINYIAGIIAVDASAGQYYFGHAYLPTGYTSIIPLLLSGTTFSRLSGTFPVTWASGDYVIISGTYQVI